MDKKVCLYYHIGQCLGYCEKCIDNEIVNNMVNEVTSFLKGNYKDVRNKINNLMYEASSNLNFELAIEYKNMLEVALQNGKNDEWTRNYICSLIKIIEGKAIVVLCLM